MRLITASLQITVKGRTARTSGKLNFFPLFMKGKQQGFMCKRLYTTNVQEVLNISLLGQNQKTGDCAISCF